MAKSIESKTPHPSAADKLKREVPTPKGEGKKTKTAVEKKPKETVKKTVPRKKKVEELPAETQVEPVSGEEKLQVVFKPERYFEDVGRRKTAVARVRLYTKPGDFLVNEKLYSIYFPTADLQKIVEEALQKMKLFGRFKVTVKLKCGGIHSQAEALRHGMARCLIKFNPDFRKRLKRAGFLKRDPRMKERKKFGLKKARRAPQWEIG